MCSPCVSEKLQQPHEAGYDAFMCGFGTYICLVHTGRAVHFGREGVRADLTLINQMTCNSESLALR